MFGCMLQNTEIHALKNTNLYFLSYEWCPQVVRPALCSADSLSSGPTTVVLFSIVKVASQSNLAAGAPGIRFKFQAEG